MEIGIYITANVIYLMWEPCRQILAAREANCHHTLRWSPFSQCSLATSGRCATNNLFIYSSCTQYSHLEAACWSWRCNSAHNEKGLRNALRIYHFMWEGPRHPCGFASAGSSYYIMWVRLFGFHPQKQLTVGGVRIGMGYVNVVTAISRYTRVPVTLTDLSVFSHIGFYMYA